MGLYLQPTDLADAVDALAQRPLAVLAGGTDFYPARVGRSVGDDILDISALSQLRGVSDAGDSFRIGATTTWSDIIAASLPRWFDGLKLAAREVGGIQIQNRGTVAGNLCNASPAADAVPALLALDAEVELVAKCGTRIVPLAEFIVGNRRTVRRADELVVAVRVPKPRHPARASFAKLGARRYLVISIVMVAAVLELDGCRVATARIAVGACSAVAQRLPALERALVGRPCTTGLGNSVVDEHLAALLPIDDVRSSAAYRMDAARTLISRILSGLAAEETL
jgi:CO/xanthine dehydrogenase FAD-binding subunit